MCRKQIFMDEGSMAGRWLQGHHQATSVHTALGWLCVKRKRAAALSHERAGPQQQPASLCNR